MLDRMLFTKEMLVAIRKGLQIQLISLALQRVPAFLELSFDQLSQLAETFSQSTFAKGFFFSVFPLHLAFDHLRVQMGSNRPQVPPLSQISSPENGLTDRLMWQIGIVSQFVLFVHWLHHLNCAKIHMIAFSPQHVLLGTLYSLESFQIY
jgi:hypothetical protein